MRIVKFGVSVRTLDTLLALNFVKKIAQGICPLGNFYQKLKIFEALISIPIMLKIH